MERLLDISKIVFQRKWGQAAVGTAPLWCGLKGGDVKTRPPETLTNADFKVLYRRRKIFFFGNISVFLNKKILN